LELPEQWIGETWTALAVSANVIEPSTVLFVVTGAHDLDNVETAYLPPNAHQPDYEALRRVGEQRLQEYNGLHRVALFKVVRDGDPAGFASMLRHELRHAEQFHRYGPGLFELNGHLRAALGVGTRADEMGLYESIPTEYDANKIAAAYAHEHYAGALPTMASTSGSRRMHAMTTTGVPMTCSRRRGGRWMSTSTWKRSGTASPCRSTSSISTRPRYVTPHATARATATTRREASVLESCSSSR
jgi:hypothetical protein